MRYELDQWAVCENDNGWTAPEGRTRSLVGLRSDGKYVRTSSIVAAKGREISTISGTVYVLKDPKPDYLQYMHSIGRIYDPDNPITVRRL